MAYTTTGMRRSVATSLGTTRIEESVDGGASWFLIYEINSQGTFTTGAGLVGQLNQLNQLNTTCPNCLVAKSPHVPVAK